MAATLARYENGRQDLENGVRQNRLSRYPCESDARMRTNAVPVVSRWLQKYNNSPEAAGSQVVVLHQRPPAVVRARRTKSPGSPQGTSEGTGIALSCHSQFSVQKLLVTRGLADSRLYSFGPRSRDRPGGPSRTTILLAFRVPADSDFAAFSLGFQLLHHHLLQLGSQLRVGKILRHHILMSFITLHYCTSKDARKITQ